MNTPATELTETLDTSGKSADWKMEEKSIYVSEEKLYRV